MKKIFATCYDYLMNPIEKRYITRWRKKLLSHAEGRVLEIGAGTGINFPLYKHCTKVDAIEPNPYMIEKARVRRSLASVPINLLESKGEHLPFPDGTFDTVVVTLVLCSVDEPKQVLKEIKRVLKPTGKMLVLEHVKMDKPFLAALQQILTPIWKQLCDGCHLNRDTEGLVKEEFRIVSRTVYLSSLAISLIAKKQ